jgi:transketolase
MTSEQFALKIRRHIVEASHKSGIAHIGSALSIADIIAVLYNDVMRIFPDDPNNDKRDRLILSKGHAGLAVYAALAEKGFFPVSEITTQGANGSRLSGHVSHKNMPGVELSTGSLGMGLSVGAGMSVAAKRDGKKHNIFVVLGDGECAEGSVWEAVMFAGHNNLSNLKAIVDCNKLQANDRCENIISWKNITANWSSFGWHVIEIDGHDIAMLKSALKFNHGLKPVCVIAHTIKGKGVSFMEDEKIWHHLSPQGSDYVNAVKELEGN